MVNIVTEIVKSTIEEKRVCRRPSPLTQCRFSQHAQYLFGFQCVASNCYEFETNNGEPAVYAAKFGDEPSTAQLLAVAGEDGHIGIIDTESSDTSILSCITTNEHRNAVMDVAWLPDAGLISVGGDKSAVMWKLREGSLHPVVKLFGHTRSVKSVAVNSFDPVMFATGGRDSNIVVWDRRCSPYSRADEIVPAHPCQGHNKLSSPRHRPGSTAAEEELSAGKSLLPLAVNNGVTSLLFTEQHQLVSSGATDGFVKVWDLRRSHCARNVAPTPLLTLRQPSTSSKLGFSCLTAPRPPSHYVYGLAMDGTVYAYHLAAHVPSPVARYSGCLNNSYYVKAACSPCGRYLLAGGSDNRALLWLVEKPGHPVAQLTGCRGEVTSVCWGVGKLAVCSDDNRQRVFRFRRSDPDDFDANLCISGRASPVNEEVLSRSNKLLDSIKRHKAQLLKTPGRSSSRGSQTLQTPSRAACQETPSHSADKFLQRSTPATPQLTPHTPSSVDRSLTLLHWLSTTKKTPKQEDCGSPQTAKLSDKKRSGIKRKLTDVIDNENEENILEICDDRESPPCARSSSLESGTQPSAAKMLRYDEPLTQLSSDCVAENMFGVPFEESLLHTLRTNNFRSMFGQSRNPSLSDETNLLMRKKSCPLPVIPENSEVRSSRFESPTANLPNFVVDGRSPCVRPSPRSEQKPRTQNWLNDITEQLKLRMREGSRLMKRRSTPNRGHKKLLRIKALCDSPGSSPCSKDKSVQSKLNFAASFR